MRPGLLMLAAMTLLGCGLATADKAAYSSFEGQRLTQGRVIWLQNCEGCHGYGTAGAPIPMIPDEWRHRLQKDMATLYQHAIEGFFGPDDTMMPPRGGNEKLTDDEVRAAVDYMATLASSYLSKAE